MNAIIRPLLLVFTIIATASHAATDKRVALVVGNQNYQSTTPLKNPISDANAIAARLDRMGFQVVQGRDLSYEALRDTVRAFARQARDADITLFYYAGHGIAVDGKSYIVPVDAKLNDPIDWEFEVYDVAEILRLIDRSPGPSLIFLDACRDNPLADILAQAQGMSSRSLNSRGIARIPTETLGTSGSVIGYATEPGQIAADGTGENSPFALALLERIDTENTDFASVTSLITRDVLEMTDGKQQPRFDVSLTGPLVLNKVEKPEPVVPKQTAALKVETPTPVAPAPVDTSKVEQLMFEAALASNDVADFQAFLSAFPSSTFAPLAQNAVNRLTAEKKKAEQQAVEVAAVNETTVAPATSAARLASAPLVLTATPAALSIISSEVTESALELDRKQRKEVQLRLNLAGFNVGSADGAIGPKTRRGISSWQSTVGFASTGYLNALQHQYLVAATETAFNAHMASNPNALATSTRKTTTRKTSSRKSSSKRRTSSKNNNNNFWKGVAVGAGAALLLKK